MPLRPDMNAQDYVEIFRRRKWLVVFSVLLVLFGASVYNVVTPEQYKSSTTILIIPQRVPENYVQSTVSVGIEGRLATIQQQVTSRTRMKAVIEELGLFKEARKGKASEEALEEMRKRIEIEVVSDKARRRDGSTEAFTISFSYEDPKKAMLGAARLASMFIDENLKTREQQAVGTSEFLESQLQETKTRLEAQEERVKQYKMKFMGELPQELQTNLSVLTRLQDHAKSNADSIRAAEDRKVFLLTQAGLIERTRQTVVREDGKVEQVPVLDTAGNLLAELDIRRARLADLSARYTDRYPEVVRLRREIEMLETRIEEARRAPAADNVAQRTAIRSRIPAPGIDRDTEEMRRIKAQMVAADAEIAALKKERKEIQDRIASFQERVDRSPRREQEMVALTRDYENLKASYDGLLKKKLDADVSQNLEKRQKGEQFEIIDPANLPSTPSKPDRKKIFGLAFFLACALGLGGPVALEMADQTLKGAKDFRHFFDLPILACIPVVQDEAYDRRNSLRKAAVFGGLASLAVAVTGFLIVYGQRIRLLLNF